MNYVKIWSLKRYNQGMSGIIWPPERLCDLNNARVRKHTESEQFERDPPLTEAQWQCERAFVEKYRAESQWREASLVYLRGELGA